MDIKDLISEGEEKEFRGEKFKIKPFTVKEQAKYTEYIMKENYTEAGNYLFVTTLKKAKPEWKEEEIAEITDKEFINFIVESALSVNGFKKKE